MHRTLVALAVCALTAGCTVTTEGRGVAAPGPRPLPAHALTGLLLDTDHLGSIMGSSLQLVESSQSMYTNAPLADGCLVWAEAQQHAYDGSGWTAVRVQQLRDRRDNADHIVYQAVVAFPDDSLANDYYDSQKTAWSNCDNRRVDLHDAGDPHPHYWSLSEASDDASILTITRFEEEDPRWSCQRALTARNNVVVDVSACAYNVNQRGSQIAKQIAQNIPQ